MRFELYVPSFTKRLHRSGRRQLGTLRKLSIAGELEPNSKTDSPEIQPHHATLINSEHKAPCVTRSALRLTVY